MVASEETVIDETNKIGMLTVETCLIWLVRKGSRRFVIYKINLLILGDNYILQILYNCRIGVRLFVFLILKDDRS